MMLNMTNASRRESRPQAIHDGNARHYTQLLLAFLEESAVETRLKRVQRQLKTTRGVYRSDWVLPNVAFWIGLAAARDRFILGREVVPEHTEYMERPLEIAAKLAHVGIGRQPDHDSDLRSRILNANYLQPVLYELDTAAQFAAGGYDIQWSDASNRQGIQIPEFIARRGSRVVEVECKTTGVNAGRRIARPHFLMLVDLLLDRVDLRSITGIIRVTVVDHMPPNDDWKTEVVQEVRACLESARGSACLPDGTTIDLDVNRIETLDSMQPHTDLEVWPVGRPNSHAVYLGRSTPEGGLESLVVCLESRTDDAFIESVRRELRRANRKFSGTRAAAICCFLPEVDTFEGLESTSALCAVTCDFLERQANPCVNVVCFSSDPQRIPRGDHVSRPMPAVLFPNHKYDRRFGPDVGVLKGGCDEDN